MFMRRAKTRRTKTAVSLAILCVLLLIWSHGESGIAIVIDASAIVCWIWLTGAGPFGSTLYKRSSWK